jgi:U3 small nucleolar RNA-associated protein 23
MLLEASKSKLNLGRALERTVHGPVKPMITQCSIRHLYDATPKPVNVIEVAKTFERRRCNHHTLEKPLSTTECFQSVLDPKKAGVNKHRYVVASQDPEARAMCRGIQGVPLIYINRSVMILEPMSTASEQIRERGERSKFRTGLASKASLLGKRKRVVEERDQTSTDPAAGDDTEAIRESSTKKKKKVYGVKGPNPLSVMKKKKKAPLEAQDLNSIREERDNSDGDTGELEEPKKQRIRKRKRKTDTADESLADIADTGDQEYGSG